MESRRRPTSLLTAWLLWVSAAAFVWGMTVFLTGGFAIEFAGRRLSSTHAARVFGIAAAALVAHYVFAGRMRLRADLASLRRRLVPNVQGLVGIALGMLVVGIGSGAVTARGCSRPPGNYDPLPIIATSPAVLDDTGEIREYLNAFPVEQYRQYEVRRLGRFFIDNTEDEIKRIIAAGEIWDAHVLELLENYVKPGTVVLDVGAHIGTHTVSIARLVGPWGRVYAFEPQRKMYRELYHNLALNGVTNAVTLRYAVGSGEARIIEMNPAAAENEGGTAVGSGGDRVELRTLDSFGFGRVSVIKIDVEHYENEVLDGAVETIRRNHPVIVIEIMGGKNYRTASPDVRERIHATWKKLERLGYTVTPVFNHDYLALPHE